MVTNGSLSPIQLPAGWYVESLRCDTDRFGQYVVHRLATGKYEAAHREHRLQQWIVFAIDLETLEEGVAICADDIARLEAEEPEDLPDIEF